MFEVIRVQTSRPAGRGGRWATYNQDRLSFLTRQEAAKWLGEQYAYCHKTIPMYQDNHVGKVGTIYCFREVQSEDGKRMTYHCQDWVTVYAVGRRIVLVNKRRS